jgi:hypothetical protein
MTTNALVWIKTNNKITVILPSGQPKTTVEGDANYEAVLSAIKNRDWDILPDLLDPKAAIYNFSDGVFEVINNVVHVEGKPVPDGLSKKIIGFAKEGLPYLPLLNFWNKLQANPSHRNVQGLFEFLDIKNYPITEDGDIIAYKGVRSDWTDRYTGTISNKIGETVRMPRNEVNDNPELECQKGFHVSDYTFALSYSGHDGHMTMVSVNPEHIVSFPNAYHFTKLRVCEYTVLSEVFKEEKGNLYKSSLGCEEKENCEEDKEYCDCDNYDCIDYDGHHQDCECNDGNKCRIF